MRHRWQGFSLIEVLVSVVLLILISYGLTKIYLNIWDGRQVHVAVLDIQQRGQIVLQTLNRYIRQAGNVSCVPLSRRQSLTENSLIGYADAAIPVDFGVRAISGSDLLLVGECQTINGAEQYGNYAFYVSDTGRKSQQGEPVLALYKKRLGGRSIEVASGVTKLDFAYGVAAPDRGDIGQYVKTDGVSNWPQVKTVQVAVSLASYNPILKAKGRRYHDRVWHSYITLQNRLGFTG